MAKTLDQRPGSKIAKKYGYIFLESIPNVYEIIEKFDKFEEGKIYVFRYDYNMKDFDFWIQKQTLDSRIRVNYLHHEIWIYREEDKYKIFIPLIQEKYRNELDYLFNHVFQFHYNRIIYRLTEVKEFNIISKGAKSFLIEITIARELKDKYTRINITRDGITVWEDVTGNKFILTKLNDVEMKKVNENIEKKKRNLG